MFDSGNYGYEYWAARNDESVDYYIRHGLAKRMAAFARDIEETVAHFHPAEGPHLQPEAIQRILDSGMKSTDTSPVGLLDPALVNREIDKSEESTGAV
jgi:hypothetical protein